MLALRILSYSGEYVAENPSIDRFGETVEKLLEDVYSIVPMPHAERLAYVRFGDPINVRDYLEAFDRKARMAVQSLTEACENAVQTGLDKLNAENIQIGAEAFERDGNDHASRSAT